MYTKHCMLFFAGAAAGSALAMLFAPKSGAEMRHDIATGVSEGGRAVMDGVTEGKRAVLEGVAEGKRAVMEGVEHAADSARRVVNRNIEIAEHAMKEGVAAYKDAKEAFADA